jgi:hypothetical protein
MRLSLAIVFLAVAVGAASASMPAQLAGVQVCTNYFGGEPDLSPEEADWLLPGGMLALCKEPGVYHHAKTFSVPVAISDGYCGYDGWRVDFDGVKFAKTTYAGMNNGSGCPRQDAPTYVQIQRISGLSFGLAWETFKALQSNGVSHGSDIVTFASLGLREPRLVGVEGGNSGRMILTINPKGNIGGLFQLTLDVGNGAPRIITHDSSRVPASRILAQPELGSHGICRFGTLLAAPAKDGVCPPGGDPSYANITLPLLGDEIRTAFDAYDGLQNGPGFVMAGQDDRRITLPSFIVNPHYLASIHLEGGAIVLNVMTPDKPWTGHYFTFGRKGGKLRLLNHSQWVA